MKAPTKRKPPRPPLRIGAFVYCIEGPGEVYVVVGETRRNWLVDSAREPRSYGPIKLPKSRLLFGWTVSNEEFEDHKFAYQHRRSISTHLHLSADSTWRKVADVIGWKPPSPPQGKTS